MITTNCNIPKKTEEKIWSKNFLYAKRNKLYSFEEEASHQKSENCTPPPISAIICQIEKKMFSEVPSNRIPISQTLCPI